MKTELLTEETLESGLNISVRENTLLKDGSLMATVSNNVANVKSTLTLIKQDGSVTSTSRMMHYLDVYQQKVLQLLSQGYTVKIMDIGLLRIKHKGKIKDVASAQNSSRFAIAFTPAYNVLNALKDLSVDNVIEIDRSPMIELIKDLARNAEDGSVKAGSPICILGRHLKLGGDADKIFFVPQTDTGMNVTDTSLWIEVAREKVFRNKPSEINLFAPNSLKETTKYKVRIQTSYLSTGIARKTELSGESNVISVIA